MTSQKRDHGRAGALRIVAEHGLPATLIERGEERFEQIADELSLEYRGHTVTKDTTLQMTPRGDLETVWGTEDTADEVIVFVTEMPRLYRPRDGGDDRSPPKSRGAGRTGPRAQRRSRLAPRARPRTAASAPDRDRDHHRGDDR